MKWNLCDMYKHFCIIIFLLFVSCSDEAGSRTVASANEKDNAGDAALSFNTYNGLIAEEPCNEKLHGISAHINENNADFICVFDDTKGIWNWRALSNSNNESEQNEAQISSIILSSSLQVASSSSYTPLYHYSSTTTVVKSSSSSKIETISSSSVKANWAYLNPAISYGEIEHSLDTYKTVTIGSQTWMAENMSDFTKCRKYKSNKYGVYGCLYTWNDAITMCPNGWHLPDSLEFAELQTMISKSQQLMSQGWILGEIRGTDDYGFSAIPIGRTTEYDIYWILEYEGTYAYFWTSSSKTKMTAKDGDSKWAFGINSTTSFYWFKKEAGLAVRCLKDEW